MGKRLKRGAGAAPCAPTLPAVVGRRIELRRKELGVDSKRMAARLGISAKVYASYETGRTQTPAALLAEIAGLLGVPVSFFFEDACHEPGDEPPSEAPGFFTVASEDERIQALSDCFRRLDLDSQQYLLAVAGALTHMRSE